MYEKKLSENLNSSNFKNDFKSFFKLDNRKLVDKCFFCVHCYHSDKYPCGCCSDVNKQIFICINNS